MVPAAPRGLSAAAETAKSLRQAHRGRSPTAYGPGVRGGLPHPEAQPGHKRGIRALGNASVPHAAVDVTDARKPWLQANLAAYRPSTYFSESQLRWPALPQAKSFRLS